jgi:hypothetical protein
MKMQFFELSFGKGTLIVEHDIRVEWSKVKVNSLEEGLFNFACYGTKLKVS